MTVEMMQLFDEWPAGLARGERPDPREYLDRAGPESDELGRLMDAFLRARPSREPDEETLVLTRAWIAGQGPLVELRARRGLRRDDLVAEVMRAFAIPAGKRGKVKRYVHELESGRLDPARLDQKLLAVLAGLLETSSRAILEWRPRPLVEAPLVAFRTSEPLLDLAVPAAAPQTEERKDEVDLLFGART